MRQGAPVRRAALVASLGACALAASTAAAADLSREDVQRVKRATVFVQVVRKSLLTGEDSTASGSGFVVGPRGYVVTCWHVVRPISESESPVPDPTAVSSIEIFLDSGLRSQKAYAATLVAFDRDADLALLAVESEPLPHIDLAGDEEPYETMPVWTFGFPLGRAFSVIQRAPQVTASRGIVSALRHDDRDALDLIQVDAAVSPGNSGGPLVDAAGSVAGVVSMSFGPARLNFAIPVYKLRALAATVDLERRWQRTGELRFSSEPAGAAIHVDAEYKGLAAPGGTAVTVVTGMRRVTLCLDGRASWIRDVCLVPGGSVHASLEERAAVDLVARSVGGAVPAGGASALPDRGEEFLREGFDREDAVDALDQNTGGTAKRTWYIADGELHQHESTGVLHSIFLGDERQADYAVSADVRIRDEHDDSRAGIVFRSTARGFYVFRIHRQSDKAQLAYHSTRPFGWFVLGETSLDVDIADRAHRMEACVRGERIVCLLDGRVVFDVTDPLARAGRVGFYSVESRASFDNLSVRSLDGPIGGEAPATGLLHYWFTDMFATDSTWWRCVDADGALCPWTHLDGVGVQTRDDAVEAVNEMTAFNLHEFNAEIVYTAGPASPGGGSAFGLVFGATGIGPARSELRVVVVPNGGRVRLVQLAGGQATTLAEAADSGVAFGTSGRLMLTVTKSSIELRTRAGGVLNYVPPAEFVVPRGRFGILTSEVRLAVHRLTISAVSGRGE
jgi:hypothetical protein